MSTTSAELQTAEFIAPDVWEKHLVWRGARITPALQIDALQTAEDLYNQNEFYRRIAPYQFEDDPEALAARLARIEDAQASVRELIEFTLRTMPKC